LQVSAKLDLFSAGERKQKKKKKKKLGEEDFQLFSASCFVSLCSYFSFHPISVYTGIEFARTLVTDW